ncbi:MAG: hypothetical protein JNK35_13860 [Phycisphaerae bacterium]|nr:hypothetical protein [Phycisphaerae bacterium]
MVRDTITQLAAAAVLAASAGGSIYLTADLAASAGRNGLTYTDSVTEGTPKEVALGIAMGAFRGLFVNVLWMRANKAKDQGNYYEAIDLARTITKLQPRFPRVWAFHAWNMAYNISVTTNTASERWQWVNNGIRLLRDEGIPANPNDLLIHRELAWIFHHKIQGFMDDANLYYKRRLADEWTVVLGPPRPADPTKPAGGVRTRQQATDDAVAQLTRILQAPETIDRIVEATPRATEVLDKLRQAGIDLLVPADRLRFLRAVETGRSLFRVQSSVKGLNVAVSGDPILEMLGVQDYVPVWELLVPHVRKRVLIDQYHMEIERMIKYTARYGPMDWRHPATHAVYWAQRGVDESLERVTEQTRADFDFVNTDRIVVQAVQELYRSGTVQFDLLRPQYYLAIPNAWFIPTYRAILDDLMERQRVQMATKGANMDQRTFNLLAAGYENFMRDAIAFLFRRGDKAEAQKTKDRLLADYKRGLLNKNDPELEHQLEQPLEEFVVAQINDRLTTPNVAVQEISGALYGAFLTGLLAGDMDLFSSQIGYAKLFHQHYMKEQIRDTGVDQQKARMEQLPRDFRETAAQIFVACVQNTGYEDGAIMYSRAPADLRQWSYDLLVEFVKPEIDQLAQGGRSPPFSLWFPEPEGVELARQARAAAGADRPRAAEQQAK